MPAANAGGMQPAASQEQPKDDQPEQPPASE